MKYHFSFVLNKEETELFFELFQNEKNRLLVDKTDEMTEENRKPYIEAYEAFMEEIDKLKVKVKKDLLIVDKQKNITRVYRND